MEISELNKTLNNDKHVVIVFFATWSGNYTLVEPIIEKVAISNENNFKIISIDVGDSLDIVEKYNIYEYPTLLFFKNGELVDILKGTFSLNQINKMISGHFHTN